MTFLKTVEAVVKGELEDWYIYWTNIVVFPKELVKRSVKGDTLGSEQISN